MPTCKNRAGGGAVTIQVFPQGKAKWGLQKSFQERDNKPKQRSRIEKRQKKPINVNWTSPGQFKKEGKEFPEGETRRRKQKVTVPGVRKQAGKRRIRNYSRWTVKDCFSRKENVIDIG